MDTLYFPIIFAAATEHRQSYTELCARVVQTYTEEKGYETEIIDAQKEIQFCHANRKIDTPEARVLRKKLERAAGFILVAPEYNHGYPGDLKNLLDSFYDEYNRKPVGIVGVSSGDIGGARMVEQLRLVGIALQMVPLNSVIHFSTVKKLFDESGNFTGQSAYDKRFEKFFGELEWYARALGEAREK